MGSLNHLDLMYECLHAYCKWIKKLAEKITKPHVLDPAYDANNIIMLITHCDITEFTSKLGLAIVHQAFHQPHLPNCTQSEQVEIEIN